MSLFANSASGWVMLAVKIRMLLGRWVSVLQCTLTALWEISLVSEIWAITGTKCCRLDYAETSQRCWQW